MLAESFAGQWFGLRRLRNASPDPTVFPEFDENLRAAMGRETRLFLEAQFRDDRPVAELLTADYSFVKRAPGAALRPARCPREPLPPGGVAR